LFPSHDQVGLVIAYVLNDGAVVLLI